MSKVFYHGVIHGLGFFICFKIQLLQAQNNNTRFFYVLYYDKIRVFDQSDSHKTTSNKLAFTFDQNE